MHVLQAYLLLAPTYLLLHLVDGKCCSGGKCVKWQSSGGRFESTWCVAKQCPDGSKIPSLFGCCGYGKCNVFCCNCDKKGDGRVCRTKNKRDLLAADEEATSEHTTGTDAEMHGNINTSGTGKMTLSEFLAYYGQTVTSADQDLVMRFNLFDRNGDGFLSADEMRL